jgi:hypothetical protein
VFHYILKLDGVDISAIPRERQIEKLTELRTIQDWIIKPQLRTVSGTAEVNSWGGFEKQFQVRIDPDQVSARKSLPTKKGLIRSIGGAIGRLVGGNRQQSTAVNAPQGLLADTSYTARLTSREFQDGKVIQVVTQGPAGQEKLKVTIPPGSRAGQKLRLRGKGVPGPKGRGDLYLILEQA